MLKLAFTEFQWLTEVKYCDILIIFYLAKLGVFRLVADRVALLPVFLGKVVVPGPHCDVLGMCQDSAVSGSQDLICGEDGTSTGSDVSRHGQ